MYAREYQRCMMSQAPLWWSPCQTIVDGMILLEMYNQFMASAHCSQSSYRLIPAHTHNGLALTAHAGMWLSWASSLLCCSGSAPSPFLWLCSVMVCGCTARSWLLAVLQFVRSVARFCQSPHLRPLPAKLPYTYLNICICALSHGPCL